jgi:hypothetical protein
MYRPTVCSPSNPRYCAAGDLSGKHTMSLWNEYRDPDLNLFGEISIVGMPLVIGTAEDTLACARIELAEAAPTWAPTPAPRTPLPVTRTPVTPVTPVTPAQPVSPPATPAPRAPTTPASIQPTPAPSSPSSSMSFPGMANVYFLLEGGPAQGLNQSLFRSAVKASFPSLKNDDQVKVMLIGNNSKVWDTVKIIKRRQGNSQTVVVAGIDKSVQPSSLTAFASTAVADLNMSTMEKYKVKMVAYNGTQYDM